MFGISLGEFFLIITIAILFIGPKDFPEIARKLIKIAAKSKSVINKAKIEFQALSKEIGIDEIKNEIAMELANEKCKIEAEITTIVDIYGKEHQVIDISEIRKDKSKEEINAEVVKYNLNNKKN